MSWQGRWRGASRPEPQNQGGAIDPATGEILSAQGTLQNTFEPQTPHGPVEPPGPPRTDAGSSTVQGERAIPSVNRERSIQSRISSSLALGTIVLLGAGFLFWYYNTQYTRSHAAEEAARKATAARAAGEMKVPPLGRVDPPRPTQNASALTSDPALPPPPAASIQAVANPNAAPPPKTPEQLALERQLGIPVLRRGSSAVASALSVTPATGAMAPYGTSGAAQLSPGDLSGMAQVMASLQGPGATPPAAAPAVGSTLGANLRTTPTPAVSAQMLPTRRLLLPKGAFIDCTLETAIDSTYEGMTTCIGASDIYGSDGKVVLLERGTKYVGEQRGEPRQGQARVFVVWNEARTPTGVVVQLASPGTDELGRSGLPGFVDTHFWQRFGAAILVSVIDGTMQAIAAHQQSGNNAGGGGGVVVNPQSGRDVVTDELRSTVNIPPTVIKSQGERIQILVARDVDFRTVYALRNDPASR